MSQSPRSAHSFGHGIRQQHEPDSASDQMSPTFLAERELHSRSSINSTHPLDLGSPASLTFTDVFQSDPQPRQSNSSRSHTRVRRESVAPTRLMSISDDDIPNRQSMASSHTKSGKRSLERSRGLEKEKSLAGHGFASLMDGSGSKDTVSDLLSKVTDNDIQKLMQLNMPLNHSKSAIQSKRHTSSAKVDSQNLNEEYGIENTDSETVIEISEHTFALSQKCKDILSQKYNHIYEMIARTETYNPLQTLRDRRARIQMAMEKGGDPLPPEIYYWVGKYQQHNPASSTVQKDIQSEWYISAEEMLNDYDWQKSHPLFKDEIEAMQYHEHDIEMAGSGHGSDSGSTRSSLDNPKQIQADAIHHYIVQHMSQLSQSISSTDNFDSPPRSPSHFSSMANNVRQKRPSPSPIRSSSHSQDSSPTGSPPPSPKVRSSLRRHVKSNSMSSLPTPSTVVPQSPDFATVSPSSQYRDIEGSIGNRVGRDKRASWGIINILKKKEYERDHFKNYRHNSVQQVSSSDPNVDTIDKRLQVNHPMMRSGSNNSVNSDSSTEISHSGDFLQFPSSSDYDYPSPQSTEHVYRQEANSSFQQSHTQNSAVSQLPDAASAKKMKRNSKLGQLLQVPNRNRIDDTESSYEGLSNEARSPQQVLSDEEPIVDSNSISKRFFERLRRDKDKPGDYDSDSSRGGHSPNINAPSAIDNEYGNSYFDNVSSLTHGKINSTSDLSTRDTYEDLQKNIDEDSGNDSSEAARNAEALFSEEAPIQRLIFNLNGLSDDAMTLIEKMRAIGKVRDITKEQLIEMQNAKTSEGFGAKLQVSGLIDDEELPEETEITDQKDRTTPKFVEVEISEEEDISFNKRIKCKRGPIDLHVTFLGNKESNKENSIEKNYLNMQEEMWNFIRFCNPQVNNFSQSLVDYEYAVSQYQRDVEELSIEDFTTEDNAESNNFIPVVSMKTSPALSGSPTEMTLLDATVLSTTRKRADTILRTAPFASLNSFAYTHQKLDENIQALDVQLKEWQTKLDETDRLSKDMSFAVRKSHEQFEDMDQVVDQAYFQTLKQIEEEIQAIIMARAQNPWQDAVYYILSLLITGLALLFWLLALLIKSIRRVVLFLREFSKNYLQKPKARTGIIRNETTTRDQHEHMDTEDVRKRSPMIASNSNISQRRSGAAG